jgi:hypothetical protein
MAGFDYESIRDSVVIPKIAEFGKSAVLTQPGPTTGDDWDPVQGTPVTYNVKVLELGPPGSNMSAEYAPDSMLRYDDRRFLMSTDNDPAPDLNGVLSVGGEDLQIVGLVANQSGPVVMFWRVRCRK